MLRTLTLKSTMQFGKYSEMKVGCIIKMDKQEYLRWVYYNMSNIGFHEDVLGLLGIVNRIEKPGKKPDWYIKEIRQYEYKILTIKEASILKMKKIKRLQAREYGKDLTAGCSKSKLMNLNRKL